MENLMTIMGRITGIIIVVIIIASGMSSSRKKHIRMMMADKCFTVRRAVYKIWLCRFLFFGNALTLIVIVLSGNLEEDAGTAYATYTIVLIIFGLLLGFTSAWRIEVKETAITCHGFLRPARTYELEMIKQATTYENDPKHGFTMLSGNKDITTLKPNDLGFSNLLSRLEENGTEFI